MTFPAFSNTPTTTNADKTFQKFKDGQLVGVSLTTTTTIKIKITKFITD